MKNSEVVFKEASNAEMKELVREMPEFILKPTSTSFNNGKLNIVTKQIGEEGEIEYEEPFKKSKLKTFIAKEGSKIIGYSIVVVNRDKSAQGLYLSMRKGYAKRGIGPKLMEFRDKELAKRGIKIINFIANIGAVKFFREKSRYAQRNPRTKRPKSFWNPFGKFVPIFGGRIKKK